MYLLFSYDDKSAALAFIPSSFISCIALVLSLTVINVLSTFANSDFIFASMLADLASALASPVEVIPAEVDVVFESDTLFSLVVCVCDPSVFAL